MATSRGCMRIGKLPPKKRGGKCGKKIKKAYSQSGKRKSISKDRKLKAKAPGWRISKSGRRYFESRRNRSDIRGKRI